MSRPVAGLLIAWKTATATMGLQRKLAYVEGEFYGSLPPVNHQRARTSDDLTHQYTRGWQKLPNTIGTSLIDRVWASLRN